MGVAGAGFGSALKRLEGQTATQLTTAACLLRLCFQVWICLSSCCRGLVAFNACTCLLQTCSALLLHCSDVPLESSRFMHTMCVAMLLLTWHPACTLNMLMTCCALSVISPMHCKADRSSYAKTWQKIAKKGCYPLLHMRNHMVP